MLISTQSQRNFPVRIILVVQQSFKRLGVPSIQLSQTIILLRFVHVEFQLVHFRRDQFLLMQAMNLRGMIWANSLNHMIFGGINGFCVNEMMLRLIIIHMQSTLFIRHSHGGQIVLFFRHSVTIYLRILISRTSLGSISILLFRSSTITKSHITVLELLERHHQR